MLEQPGLMSRLARWFKRRPVLDLPADPARVPAVRSSILRPWARRDAAINALAQSFSTLTELMGSIRDSLEKQTRRQDELSGYLQNLPQLMATLPESQKMQAETLRMVVGQMEQQNLQQARLGEILEKIGDAHQSQRQILESLGEHVQTLSGHDQSIADNLKSVGVSMENVGRSSQSSAEMLRQLRFDSAESSQQLAQILRRQNTRFTALVVVAIFLAVAALGAVGTLGYLLLKHR
jgi:chromosome segregation ATPase